MSQIHKRFTDEQVKALLDGYCQGKLKRTEIQQLLEVGKTRFFALVKAYRQSPASFSVAYQRKTHGRLPDETEKEIKSALLKEKEIVENPELPISGYNYSAIQDRLAKRGIRVSATTIIARAKRFDCHKARRKKKKHDREVLTSSIGALIQHDSSLHLWAPLAQKKWYLVTSIDDFSRMLLFADFFEKESTWTHIQAVKRLVSTFGLPLRYYVDSLRVFRFVQGRDSHWRKHILQTDDVDTQWRKMMHLLAIDVYYALSPQAKGKIERPYRWLQDRIVRTCIYEGISTLAESRSVLRDEMHRYNHRQVHATTGEIPALRFKKALKEGNSVFRKLVIPKPYAAHDIFCLREKRTLDAYRRISLFNNTINIPKVDPYQEIDVHMIPIPEKGVMHLRFWKNKKIVHKTDLPLDNFRVHF